MPARVPRHQVGGGRREGNVPAVGADGGEIAPIVALRAAGAGGAERDLPRLEVLSEDITFTVGITGHQVGGVGFEGNVPAVGADGGIKAVAVALRSRGVGGAAHDISRLRIRRSCAHEQHEHRRQGAYFHERSPESPHGGIPPRSPVFITCRRYRQAYMPYKTYTISQAFTAKHADQYGV